MDEDIKTFGCCVECNNEITDDIGEIFVDTDGNYFDSVDCLIEYFGVTRLEV